MASTPDDLPPADKEEPSDRRLPLTELEGIGTRRPSWRKRGVQLALLALALCVGLVATWSIIFPKRQAAPSTPALIPITALLVSNLTNATITLNGKQLAGHPPMPVSAYLESDTITIVAPLFRPHTCHLKELDTGEDSTHCLFTTNGGLLQNGPTFLIGIYLTPDDLLPSQRAQIMAPLMQQLSVGLQTTTLPGDSFATAFDEGSALITSQRVTTPLQASATLAQIGPGASISPAAFPSSFSPFCEHLLCPFGFGPVPYQVPAGQVWGLVLNVRLRWRFANDTGTPIADITYQQYQPAGLVLSLPEAQYTYDAAGWHLAANTNLKAEMPAFLCGNGLAILGLRLPGGGGTTTLANRGAEGCLISSQTALGSGAFLWRFGVLLAADAGAHAILPDLPIASPSAIAAVSG